MEAADGHRARGPVAVDAAGVPAFLAGAPLAVLLISLHPAHAFSGPLARQLTVDHPGIALGTVDLRDLVIRGGRGLRAIQAGGRRCGVPGPFGILPGYCLFRDGALLAWDAGVPLPIDLTAIAQSAMLGAVCSGVTRDPSFLHQALRIGAEEAAADRVALRFRAALDAATADPGTGSDADREPSTGPADALAWAYQRLEVTPDATDAQVHEAWKRLRIAHHPDRAAGDVVEFERRSRDSADVNRARDIILECRSAGRPRGAWARAS